MNGGTRKPVALVVFLLALALVAVLAAAPVAGKGKKKRRVPAGPITFSSGPIDAAVPDALAVPPFTDGVLTSTINVSGKRFRGSRIEDVNVSLRGTHPGMPDVTARLIAPNGATVFPALFLGGNSWGAGSPDCGGTFFTLDDETPTRIGYNTPGAFGELSPPYAGTAHPSGRPLAVMDGGPVNGTWTLNVRDHDSGNTGTLHCWQVHVTVRPRPKAGSKRRKK